MNMHRDKLDPEEAARHRGEGYRALGHYFAEFSEMLGGLEARMVDYFRSRDVPDEIAYLPFGAMTADAITSVFFAMARQLRGHDEKDLRVAKKLRTMVRDQIAFRNDAAHGRWMIGYWEIELGDSERRTPLPPRVDRTKPGREGGSLVSITEDLDAKADEATTLDGHLHYYAFWSYQGGRVPLREMVRLNDKGEIIHGPLAIKKWKPPTDRPA